VTHSRVVLAIGAGQGIGRAVAERFARAGDRLVVADRSEENARAVAQSVSGRGDVVDVTDEASVIALFDRVMATEGRIDVMVNSAGILHFNTNLVDVTLADWDALMRVNLTGTFLCAREAARRMVPHSGASIVNISSGASAVANQNQVAYNSSKAGVAHFTRSAAMDLADMGIRVNAVSPGPVESPMTQAFSSERLAYMASGVPLSRLALPEEVAGAAFYLASAEAAYVTGADLVIDGGTTVAGRLARHLPQ
jgi:NAD(P)-dependent dehydrogenase (short-subunit alcohol dehydrogenase family)